MALQAINLGVAPSGAGGDAARTAFEKMNNNFNNPEHAASRMVQASPTAPAAGALMAVGAFGLGAMTQTNLSSINLDTANLPVGFYSGNNWSGTMPAWWVVATTTWGYLQVENLASSGGVSYAKQTLTAGFSNRRAWRLRVGGNWGGWVEDFHTGNILGTVSQLNGVPTGAIIERGSNANGEYIKWVDGSMICLLNTVVTDQALDAAYGSFFTGTRAWTFPASFISPPVVPPPAFNWGTSASWGHSRAATTSTNVVLRGLDIVTRAAGTSTYIQAIAIGRWF